MPFQERPKICPICKQGKEFKFIRDFGKKRDKFSLYQCSECQAQFWLPLKIPELSWYEEKAFRIKNSIKPKIYTGYHKKFLKTHKSFPENTRILDLGCAAGEFIAELQKRGCEVWGVDFDKENIKIAKEYFGLERVFALSFEEFFRKKDLPRFDVISFLAVIGYLDDPLEFIQNVKNLLKPNGMLVLNAPSRERMLVNLNHWDFPPHYFTRWNKQAISNIFQKKGFIISRIDYVEQFKTLLEAMTSKFRTGLAGKSLAVSKNKRKSLIFPRMIYFLGLLKSYIIGTVPAAFFWTIGKGFNRKNGTMLVELKQAEFMNKKIIFLIPTLGMGGGERVVSDLSLALPDSIEKIIVLFKNEIFYPYKGELVSLDIPLSNRFLFKIYYFFIGLYRFRKIIKKENPDHIFSFGFPADMLGILTSPGKTLVAAHSLWSKSHGGWLEKNLINLFFNRANKIICVSKTVAEDLLKNFNIRKEKIKVIYNPINIEKIQGMAGLPLEPEYQEIFRNPVIITMGRLSEEKNHMSLIMAFKKVKNKIREANLVILGEGEKEASLKKIVKELNLEDSVYLLGRQNNPFKFLAKAKVFVLSSLREGLPCSILEAMALGLPIVSTDCKSGPREILAPRSDIKYQAKDIEYAEFGLLTPIDSSPDSEKKIAEAVTNILTDKKLSDNLIKKSEQRAEDFNIKNIIKEWEFLENDETA